jgi:pilus assembly protein CpaC
VRNKIVILIACIFSFCLVTLAVPTLTAQAPATPAPPSGTSTQDSANDLVVAVGKSVLVDCAKPIERIAVGTGDFAEATAVSPTEILLNGKAPGETSLIVWQVGGVRQFFNVAVRVSSYATNDRLDVVRRELRTELPGQTLRITSENGLVFLRGTVKDLRSSDRAVQIASTAGKVVNLLYVNVPPAEPQILLKVRFASLDRNLQKQLGINFFSLGAGNTVGAVTTGQFSPPTITPGTAASGTTSATPATSSLSNLLNIFLFRQDLNLGATIQALETNGVLQVLAEPNLLTANGKQGSFLAGGQYPYPVVQGAGAGGVGAVTIAFKEFGVRLNFIPTITPRGTIRLQVAPEVSALDYANGITISGFTVPGLDTRKMKTEVELAAGQSFAIAGLLDQRETKNLSKIPFIGDIPVLGKFFQSMNKVRSNTELMVIVTPEIVNPIPVGAPLPVIKYPDQFLPPIPTATANSTADGAPRQAVSPESIPASPTSIPVEQLIQSMQPEQQLQGTDSSSSGAGYGSSQTGVSSTPPPQ